MEPGTQPAFGVGIYSREESLKTILNAKKLKVLCIEKNSYGTKESIAGKNIKSIVLGIFVVAEAIEEPRIKYL